AWVDPGSSRAAAAGGRPGMQPGRSTVGRGLLPFEQPRHTVGKGRGDARGTLRGGIWLVLHLDAKKRGSMEQQLVALAERLKREAIPVTMVFAAEPAPYPGRDLRAAGVDVRAVDFAAPGRALTMLAKWFAAERPELVHFHFI